jgi:hypothetical protein
MQFHGSRLSASGELNNIPDRIDGYSRIKCSGVIVNAMIRYSVVRETSTSGLTNEKVQIFIESCKVVMIIRGASPSKRPSSR